MKNSTKKWTLAGTAFAGTLIFAGTALAEPYNPQNSLLGFDAKTNVIVHLDNDALNASKLGQYWLENQQIFTEKFQTAAESLGQIADQTVQLSDEDFAFSQAISKQISSISAGGILADDAEPVAINGYLRGKIELENYIEKIVKKYYNADVSTGEIAGVPTIFIKIDVPANGVPATAQNSENSENSEISENSENPVPAVPAEKNPHLTFAKIDGETWIWSLAKTKTDAVAEISKILENRAAGTLPAAKFKLAGTPNCVIFADCRDFAPAKSKKLKQILLENSEQNDLYALRVNVRFDDAETAQKIAAEATQNLQTGAVMVSYYANTDGVGDLGRKALNLLAQSLVQSTVGCTDDRVTFGISLNVPATIALLEDVKNSDVIENMFKKPAVPADDALEDYDDDDDEDDDENDVPANKIDPETVAKNVVPAEAANACDAFLQNVKSAEFLLNGNVKPDAKFYIVLCSASWCGPCRHEMPRISKEYSAKIKENPDVELVMISFDRDSGEMKTWAEKEKIEFPVTIGDWNRMETIFGTKVRVPRGIPHMYIFRADGPLIADGHPADLFEKWEALTAEAGTGK